MPTSTRNHIRPDVPSPDDLPIYKASEVAAILRVSPSSLYRWMDEGRFPEGLVIEGLKLRRWSMNMIREGLGVPALRRAASSGDSGENRAA